MHPDPIPDQPTADLNGSDADDALKLAQLMCSRLCHDLVGPMGGVSAGLELLADSGDVGVSEAAREALDLLTLSAGQLTRRIAFFRLAFGMGGGAASAVPMTELRDSTAGFLADGSIDLDWSDNDLAPEERVSVLPGNAAKLILVMILLASGALVRGGRLSVHAVRLPEGIGLAVTATGINAMLKDDIKDALQDDRPADDLTARSVHAHLAHRLAVAAGGVLEIETAINEVRLAALVSGETDSHRPAP